jgi:hypothetical protein
LDLEIETFPVRERDPNGYFAISATSEASSRRDHLAERLLGSVLQVDLVVVGCCETVICNHFPITHKHYTIVGYPIHTIPYKIATVNVFDWNQTTASKNKLALGDTRLRLLPKDISFLSRHLGEVHTHCLGEEL